MTQTGRVAALVLSALLGITIVNAAHAQSEKPLAQLGPRPFFLVDDMDDGRAEGRRSSSCEAGPFYRTDFSIGHRGAALQFPEHTRGVLRGGRAHGRRHRRVRRDLHQGPPARLPPLAVRPAHDDQHPRHGPSWRRSARQPFTPADRGHRQEGRRRCAAPATSRSPSSRRCAARWTPPTRRRPRSRSTWTATPTWRTDLYADDAAR